MQAAVSETITRDTLKARLIQRCFNRNGTLKSMFDEWRLPNANWV